MEKVKTALLIFCVGLILIFNGVNIEPSYAGTSRSASFSPGICKIPSSVGFSINSKGRISFRPPQKLFLAIRETSPQALPKGKDDFWYQTRKAGLCEEDLTDNDLQIESGIYTIEFPQKDGTVITRIGETKFLARRHSQHMDGLRRRERPYAYMLPYMDQLQVDFPEEKNPVYGLVFPRFTILEKGSDLVRKEDRMSRETHYKKLVELDPDRVLINPKNY